MTPQWPWTVYSQRQTSVMTTSSGHALERAHARCTAPLVPCIDRRVLLVGNAEEDHAARRRGESVVRLRARARSSTECRGMPGSAEFVERLGPDRRAASRSRRGRAAFRARGRGGRCFAAAGAAGFREGRHAYSLDRPQARRRLVAIRARPAEEARRARAATTARAASRPTAPGGRSGGREVARRVLNGSAR